ncbi:MAG: purine-nucleoside phosphorylase [Flavobacteriales bacterium]
MLRELTETSEFIKKRIDCQPEAGIILGTGIGKLADEIEATSVIPYSEIPNFPQATVEGHMGNLIIGKLEGKNVIAMQGRFHYYEANSMDRIVFPVRVMRMLGIKALFLSNACGGVNNDFEIGDIMIIEDHINLFPSNPLIGPNYDELGPRFPDMSEPYNKEFIAKAEKYAKDQGIAVKKGVYVGLSGPTLETPAEYKYVNIIGGDAVGMSTVPEVIAARHMGIPCFGIAVITDLGVPGKIAFVTHEMVQQVAATAEPIVTAIFRELINSV